MPGNCLNSRKDEEFFLSYQRDIAKEYGVVCFSETCQDPSLWGHYADRFRGICLGFDTAFHGDDEEDLIGKVNYVQKRIDTGKFRDLLTYFKSSNSQYDNNISTQIQTLMYTKSFNWAYEKEWRLWVEKMHQDPVTGLHFADFGPLVLREILIGFRCPEEDIESRLDKLVASYSDPPKISFTRRSLSTFEIVREPS